MAAITPQVMSLSGVAPTYNAASSGGDTFLNDGRTYAHFKNGAGSAITVTFDAVADVTDNALGEFAPPDLVVTVPAGGEKIVGNFPPARFNGSTGNVSMSYSSATSLTVAVIREDKAFL